MTFTHLRGFVVRSVAPVLFAGLGFLALVAGEARAENDPDITVVLVAIGPNTATATFSAPPSMSSCVDGPFGLWFERPQSEHTIYMMAPPWQQPRWHKPDHAHGERRRHGGDLYVLETVQPPSSLILVLLVLMETFFNTMSNQRFQAVPTNIDRPPAATPGFLVSAAETSSALFWPPLPVCHPLRHAD